MAKRRWKEIEDKFRLWSFHIYYERSFANEIDPTLRFVKALIASAQPIRDRQAVLDWYHNHLRRKKKRPTTGARGGPPCPEAAIHECA
jgi:hypothetical protein